MPRLLSLLVAFALPVQAAPQVATDIAPVHSIVSAMMQGVGTPTLILPATGDPHHHALRPSQAQQVAGADLVIWIGPSLTPWLETALDSLAPETPDLALLPESEGESESEGHDETDHAHDGHDHGGIDPHLWLDPTAMAQWLPDIAAALQKIDPENAATYTQNQNALSATLAELTSDIARQLADVKDRPFITSHEALGHFEERFDLNHAGSIRDSEAARPSVSHLRALRQTVLDVPVTCLLIEPSTSPNSLLPVTDGTGIATMTVDILGQNQTVGAALYPAMMTELATSVASCLR